MDEEVVALDHAVARCAITLHDFLGFARRVAVAAAGSSGQGCLG
jgi:hypothetical protein